MYARLLTIWLTGIGILACIGCGSSETHLPTDQPSLPPHAASDGVESHPTAPTHTLRPTTRQVIHRAEVSVSVDDVRSTNQRVKQLMQTHEAIVSHSTMNGESGSVLQSQWTIRVTPSNYEPFLNALGELGDLRSRVESSEDVTGIVVDLEARIRNKTQEEARLITHLATSTGNLEEILRVEKEISRVREDLERMQGQRAGLKDRVDWSTITLNLFQKTVLPPDQPVPFLQRAIQAWNSSWSAVMAVGRFAILALTVLLPWVLVFSIPTMIIWRIRRSLTHRPASNSKLPQQD